MILYKCIIRTISKKKIQLKIKVFSYQKVGKRSKTVLEALEKFFNDVANVCSLTNDQDKGYKTNNVLDFIKSRNNLSKN